MITQIILIDLTVAYLLAGFLRTLLSDISSHSPAKASAAAEFPDHASSLMLGM